MSILQYFWPALCDKWSWKPIFYLFESGRFTQVLLYVERMYVAYFLESDNKGADQTAWMRRLVCVFVVEGGEWL